VLLAGLYLLARQLMTDERPRRLITGSVTVLAFAVAIGYLLAVVARWVGWWMLVGAPALPPLGPGGEGLVFGDPGTVAAIAILGLDRRGAPGTEHRRTAGAVRPRG
jgi:hypothetical protein